LPLADSADFIFKIDRLMLEGTIAIPHLDRLTAFGLLAVSLMLLFYALEERSPSFVLAFAGSCLMASVYGFLQGAWPFGLVEGVWSLVAIRRWHKWAIKTEREPARLQNNVHDFLGELKTIAQPAGRGDYTFPKVEGGLHGSVQFIFDSPRTVTIHRFWTLQPGQGSGSQMLRTLCELADRHGVELRLKAIPIGRKPYPMTRDQLFAWYQRHGFEGTRRKMIRMPRQAAHADR